MKQETKAILLRKLTSRKFWLTVAGLIATFCSSVGFGDTVAAHVASIITAGGLIIAYVFGESIADASASADNASASAADASSANVGLPAGETFAGKAFASEPDAGVPSDKVPYPEEHTGAEK